MATDAFVPEIWSTSLQVAFRNELVFAGPAVSNRNYEGEIANAGDTVRITSIGRPTIGTYVPNQTVIVPQNLQAAQRTLTIDQIRYFAFEVDDVNARQQLGTFITESMSEAAYGLADEVDTHVASLWSGIPSANDVGTVTIDHSPTDANEWNKVYDQLLIPLKVRLDELNVPQQGRYVTMPAWVHGAMLRDGRFIKADESADASALRQGMVGRAAGFDIMMSNKCPEPTNGTSVIQAGTNAAITFAEQINKTEAYRPESAFSDAVKGMVMWGAKIIRPDCIVMARAVQQA